MDPNATLHRIRVLLDQHDQAEGHALGAIDRLNELAELTRAMDDWLSGGGFLPDAWRTEEIRTEGRGYDLVNPGKVHDLSSPSWSIADLD